MRAYHALLFFVLENGRYHHYFTLEGLRWHDSAHWTHDALSKIWLPKSPESASHPLECTCITEIVSIVDIAWSLPFASVVLAVGQRGVPQVCQRPRPMNLSTMPVVATCSPPHVPLSVCQETVHGDTRWIERGWNYTLSEALLAVLTP